MGDIFFAAYHAAIIDTYNEAAKSAHLIFSVVLLALSIVVFGLVATIVDVSIGLRIESIMM